MYMAAPPHLLTGDPVSSLTLAHSVIFMEHGTAVQRFKGPEESKDQLNSLPSIYNKLTSSISSQVAASREPLDSAEALVDNSTLTEDLARQTGDTHVYAYYAKAVGWPFSLAFLLSNAVVIFGMKFPDIWLKWWSEDEKAYPGQRTWLFMGVNIGLAICALASVVVMLLVLFILAVPQASARIHKRLLDTVINAPYSFFAATAAGVTLNRYVDSIIWASLALTEIRMQI
jgi:ABC-type multidrug transport system fused ATPase/permease subunit